MFYIELFKLILLIRIFAFSPISDVNVISFNTIEELLVLKLF